MLDLVRHRALYEHDPIEADLSVPRQEEELQLNSAVFVITSDIDGFITCAAADRGHITEQLGCWDAIQCKTVRESAAFTSRTYAGELGCGVLVEYYGTNISLYRVQR